jgi:hypothetical protein
LTSTSSFLDSAASALEARQFARNGVDSGVHFRGHTGIIVRVNILIRLELVFPFISASCETICFLVLDFFLLDQLLGFLLTFGFGRAIYFIILDFFLVDLLGLLFTFGRGRRFGRR